MIIYLGLFFETGELIEKARLGANRQISFSYRFAPDNADYLAFDRDIGYPEFRKYCKELAAKFPFVVDRKSVV
jgi:hypothetical protein